MSGNRAWFMSDTTWSRLGLGLAGGLLALAPLVRRRAGHATLLTYLQLPAYMLHQYEEHGHGAFKREMNTLLPPGVGRLTDCNIFLSNVIGVWATDAAALILAARGSSIAGLLPSYLAVVNAFLHIAPTLGLRRYTPGLVTALALFLPFGGYSIRAIGRDTRVTRRDHAVSVAIALVLHVGVVLLVARERETDV
jgi:hypothetical protein